ncbi:MAG: hypothetical protein M3P23_08340 [Actinomycetota bacterium]|nr:hypothetical protein [Actinomycetota bacterium]
MTGPDPFGTAAVRERVLTAWAASPARLREDANAEEDFSLGGYRDRVIVELAQNAADAAAAAGEPGRLRLSLTSSADGSVLAAANTGTPLDAAGVGALASLRASAKRGETAVGRFGVGFAAVLSVSDEPILLSRNGSVRFSRADTAQLVVDRADVDSPELADELRRRDGQVPVLRLPFEAEGEPPQGFSTVVLLPLRDDAAADLAHRLLGDVDDALLLALPGLEQVEIEVDGATVVLRDAHERWEVVASSGGFNAAERRDLFADRPTEEAHRPWWSVLWALPRQPAVAVPQVVHAPTPTDEPLTWPALLIASFPLDPSRRHVAPGPLTDRVVAEAARAYADLLIQRAAEGLDVLGLVPVGLGAGALDGALRLAALDVLRGAPILRSVPDDVQLRPRDAVMIDGIDPPALAALAPYVAGLVDAPLSGRTALRQLGVQVLDLSEVVEALPYPEDPAAWAERYAGLAALGETPEGREALGVLPVPLADGRVVRGSRGLLLPPATMSQALLQELATVGIRLVHPEAAHPLLARLGALPATPRQLLDDAAVRELVDTSPESDEPDVVAATVLDLVQAAVADGELAPGDLSWLGDLALPDADDELAPAAALALPGSVAAQLLDPDEIGVVAAELVERYGSATLCAAGVLDGFAVLHLEEVDLSDPDNLPDALLELDGFADWATASAGGGDGAIAGELLAVQDLDAVRSGEWAQVVRALADAPSTRPALVHDVRLRDRHGRGHDVPSYTAWWLRRELGLEARCDPGGDPALVALLDPAPEWVAELDGEVRRALGLVRDIGDLGPGAVPLVLDRLADTGRELAVPGLLSLWWWLAAQADRLESDGIQLDPPNRVRATGVDGLVGVFAADEVVVVDQPMWLQRNDCGPMVLAPPGNGPALADLLDLALASERAPGVVTSRGVVEPVPERVADVLPQAARDWRRHEAVQVDGVDVDWWVDGDGHLHASGPTGLARALAWSARRWSQRFLVGAVLADAGVADRLLADAAFD